MNDFELMLDKCENLIRGTNIGLPTCWLKVREQATTAYILQNFPKMEKVESSNVDRIGYDPQNKIAYVLFLNRSMYMYLDVPKAEFENLKYADSVGSYFSRTFRSKYESKKCIKVGLMGF